MPPKMLTESFLFIANFALQRDFVFARRLPTSAVAEPDEEDMKSDIKKVRAALTGTPSLPL